MGARRRVPRACAPPCESLAHREQGRARAARPRARGGVMARRLHPEAEPRLRLRQHRERVAVAVVLERSEEHTSELQSPCNLVCRLLLEKKKTCRTRRVTTNRY